MPDDRHVHALERGLSSLDVADPPPPLGRFESLVTEVRAREEARFRRDLRWFSLAAAAVTTLVLVACARSQALFLALQAAGFVGALVAGLGERRAAREPS